MSEDHSRNPGPRFAIRPPGRGPRRVAPGPPPLLLSDPQAALAFLTRFLADHERLVVLTGAGCSTESGVPAYRDANGAWQHADPIQHQDFLASEHTRRRYWSRSMVGWRRMAAAVPNAAHRTLAALERTGRVTLLVTQNVDGLHQRAGSRDPVELHGSVHRVMCLSCGTCTRRADVQRRLCEINPQHASRLASDDDPGRLRPDGDAAVAEDMVDGFELASCDACGGILKPDVVFFGDSVPVERVARVREALRGADALLVVGTSLMVYSGFRFARQAAECELPMLAVNVGVTRADPMLEARLAVPCAELLGLLEAKTGSQR